MKTLLIIAGVLLLVFLAFQVWAGMSTNRTEQYSYSVLKEYSNFEVRHYESAVFARTQIDAETYRAGSGNGFRTLASYIFGGNERNESIAMTAPVTMRQEDGLEMEFMMPSKYTLETLPAPMRDGIEFYEKPEVVMAAIRFGGWASDSRIEEMTEQLKEVLSRNNIVYKGPFLYMGYNPPYQLLNRRNEIVVEVIGF